MRSRNLLGPEDEDLRKKKPVRKLTIVEYRTVRTETEGMRQKEVLIPKFTIDFILDGSFFWMYFKENLTIPLRLFP